MTSEDKQRLLRRLPGIDRLISMVEAKPSFSAIPRAVLIRSARTAVDQLRETILAGDPGFAPETITEEAVFQRVIELARQTLASNLIRTVNATGVVVHTNLGRSLLCRQALENVAAIGGRYTNLEFDLKAGRRGSRYSAVEGLLCEISGAESALVVNNNAGAVLLCLETLARGKKVVVSRGELVEIGGSFRIPDVMAKSGGILTEVGTTNRTHLDDYQNAIDEDTALLLKVHKSNYQVIGFTAEVAPGDLAALGHKHRVPVVEDLGSGTFIDFSQYGIAREPTVQDSIAAGVDVVTFSGDKLLGGPQAGIIVGKKALVDKLKKNPLTRALRIDKMTLAALESTLQLYRQPEEAIDKIPTLRMLTLPFEFIDKKADELASRLTALKDPRIAVVKIKRPSRAGGGALPLEEFPSACVAVKIDGWSVNAVERFMRRHKPPIIGRIEENLFLMDLRTLQEDEFPIIEAAFEALFGES